MRFSLKASIAFAKLAAATGSFSDETKIGSGATGDVYRGILEGDVAVAVKVLRLPDAAGPEVKAALQRAFEREVSILASFRSPRIVRLLCFSHDSGSAKHPYALVFELLEGGSVADWLRAPDGSPPKRCAADGKPLAAQQRVDIALGGASGLAYLHGQREHAQAHDDAPAVGGAGAGAGGARGASSAASSSKLPIGLAEPVVLHR